MIQFFSFLKNNDSYWFILNQFFLAGFILNVFSPPQSGESTNGWSLCWCALRVSDFGEVVGFHTCTIQVTPDLTENLFGDWTVSRRRNLALSWFGFCSLVACERLAGEYVDASQLGWPSSMVGFRVEGLVGRRWKLCMSIGFSECYTCLVAIVFKCCSVPGHAKRPLEHS